MSMLPLDPQVNAVLFHTLLQTNKDAQASKDGSGKALTEAGQDMGLTHINFMGLLALRTP